MGQSSVGVQARLMSQALRKLTAIMAKSKTLVVFINQLRQKLVSCTEIRKQLRRIGAQILFQRRLDIRRIEAINKAMWSWEAMCASRCQKQGGATFPSGGIRHHVRVWISLRAACWIWGLNRDS